jgi:hypothetical protein
MFNVGSRIYEINSSSILRRCYSLVEIDLRIKADKILTGAFSYIGITSMINHAITKIVENNEE